MKKTFIAFISYSLFLAILITNAKAQGHNNVIAYTDTRNFMNSVRSLYVSLDPADMAATSEADASSVNSKAIKDFKSRFGNAAGEKWFQVSFGYLSYFKASGIENRVLYDKKGRWQYTLKSYSEDKFAHDLRSIVRRAYFDDKINLIEEIEAPNSKVYIVHLENATQIRNLRVTEDGEMEVMAEFQKP